MLDTPLRPDTAELARRIGREIDALLAIDPEDDSFFDQVVKIRSTFRAVEAELGPAPAQLRASAAAGGQSAQVCRKRGDSWGTGGLGTQA